MSLLMAVDLQAQKFNCVLMDRPHRVGRCGPRPGQGRSPWAVPAQHNISSAGQGVRWWRTAIDTNPGQGKAW